MILFDTGVKRIISHTLIWFPFDHYVISRPGHDTHIMASTKSLQMVTFQVLEHSPSLHRQSCLSKVHSHALGSRVCVLSTCKGDVSRNDAL